MRFRNVRVATALTAFGLFIALAGLIAPTALGAPSPELRFLTQPQDAEAGALIRSGEDLDPAAGFVEVQLWDASTNTLITNSKALVTFQLKTGPGLASGDVLRVSPQPLVNGVATFGGTSLRILTENEPQFTDYQLIPFTTKNPIITGPASDPFDVWEDGEACDASGPSCDAFLRGSDGDHYSLLADGTLGASELVGVGVLPGLTCPGQALIFDNRIFSYATTETDLVEDTPVFLSNHITRADWRASANNGQAHADWCIGLPTAAPWENNGASYREVDFNGDAAGGVLFVALAPKCPVANPQGSAPCIVSQKGDGKGGSISLGWLTGGDPPRRT
jgi:hypothetical protein